MIIGAGGRRAAIRVDEATAMYPGFGFKSCERPASGESGQSARAVVELRRSLGGVTMRALLGARFVPGAEGPATLFEVPFGAPLGLGAPAHCASELGRPLVAGLPSDFAGAALTGLAGAALLPAGIVRVDRAGHDEVGSSEKAFQLVGELLREVIRSLMSGQDTEAVARSLVEAW